MNVLYYLTRRRYRDLVMTRPDFYWCWYLERFGVSHGKGDAIIDANLAKINELSMTIDENPAIARQRLRRAIALLYASMRPDLVEQIMRTFGASVLYVVDGFIENSDVGLRDGRIVDATPSVNISMSLLLTIIKTISMNMDNEDKSDAVVQILNELPLPYWMHCTIIDTVQDSNGMYRRGLRERTSTLH